MRDLGLPVFDDHGSPSVAPVEGPKCVGAGRESASSKKGDVTVQKFQLGPTLPVVPARIVRRVLRGDYVDMAELSEDNLELELRRSTEGEEGKLTPPSKLKPVADPLTWARSFCIYAGIVVSAHPDKARDLLAYLATLLAGAEKGDWWRAYDSRFRQQIPALESAEFGKLDQALFTRSIFATGVAGSGQRGGASVQAEGRSVPPAKRRRVAPCFAWNDGKLCASTPCRFSHVCSKCGGDHRKFACTPPVESASGPASSV